MFNTLCVQSTHTLGRLAIETTQPNECEKDSECVNHIFNRNTLTQNLNFSLCLSFYFWIFDVNYYYSKTIIRCTGSCWKWMKILFDRWNIFQRPDKHKLHCHRYRFIIVEYNWASEQAVCEIAWVEKRACYHRFMCICWINLVTFRLLYIFISCTKSKRTHLFDVTKSAV